MNLEEKTLQMKKYILLNKVFIALQVIFTLLSIIFNIVSDDPTVFVTVFIHIGLFVVYNIVVENIVEYGYIRKKFKKECNHYTHPLSSIKIKRQIYKIAKINDDRVTSTLIIQSLIKTLIAIINIILLIFMVSFK